MSQHLWLYATGLGILVFAADMACPSGMTADSMRSIDVGWVMVHLRTINLDALRPLRNGTFAISVVNGHYYPYFPWAVSLFAVPWIILYDLAHKVGIGGGTLAMLHTGHDWPLQVLSMSAVVAVTSVLVFYIALRVLRLSSPVRQRRWALGVALAFAFATPAWSTASRSMWQHGPSMLCISAGLLFALRARDGQRGWAGMGASLAAGYCMRPTDSIVFGVIMVWALFSQRRQIRNFLSAVAGSIAPFAILVTVNELSYHAMLSPYYSGSQNFAVTRTMLVALAGNLISPSRGLFIFCPLVVLSIVGLYLLWRRRELDGFWIALGVIPILHWIVISAFKHWWGGDSFGPRFFTDIFPIFTVLALPAVQALAERSALRRPLARRRVFATLSVIALMWSFLVNAQGAILRSAWCWNNEPTDVDQHPGKVWSWSDPQFARGIRTLIWGPNRASEFIRDGVDLYGCPTEPVRP